MTLNASIGSRIAQLRKNHNMTQEQLAEELDISIKHCSAVERGLSSLSLEKLVDVSYLFDVTLDYLVKGSSQSGNSLKSTLDSFPESIITIMSSDNAKGKQLLLEYLQLFSKIQKSAV